MTVCACMSIAIAATLHLATSCESHIFAHSSPDEMGKLCEHLQLGETVARIEAYARQQHKMIDTFDSGGIVLMNFIDFAGPRFFD